MDKKNVVILGGGYGGVHAAQTLDKLAKSRNDIEILLINKTPYHVLLTALHEVAGNRVQPEAVRLSLGKIFKNSNVRVVEDTIINVDINKQILNSDNNSYNFDYLILGFGSEPAFFGIPGMEEHAFTLWSFEDALKIKTQIVNMFCRASSEKDPQVLEELLTFVVGGGGFTGIEMMGELTQWVNELCGEYSIDRNNVKLIVVEALPKILTNLSEKSKAKAIKYLNKNGVEILTDSPITKVSENLVELKTGRAINTRTLIWTGGIQNNKLSENLGLSLGNRGRIETNEYMQSKGSENVYVVGDNVWYKDDKSGMLPPLVETAIQTAECAAKNIINNIEGKESVSLAPAYHGVMVSIGGEYSVSEIGGTKLSWIFSDVVKHLANIHYAHGVGGFSFTWEYILDNFLRDKNRRTFAGGLLYGKTPGIWLAILRMFLGIMWFKSGVEKVASGWLSIDSSASATIVNTLTSENAVSWYKTFIERVVVPNLSVFLAMITITELLLGIALFFGGLTVLAAIGSIAMVINFFLSGTGDWWFLIASLILLFSNAGIYFGADYFIIPLLKSWFGLDRKKWSAGHYKKS